MHDTSSPDRLPADLADSLRRATLGTPSAPLFSNAQPKATSREKKAALAKMDAEERRAAEMARKVEAKLARAEARLAQQEADYQLLHNAGRCWAGCPHCAPATLTFEMPAVYVPTDGSCLGGQEHKPITLEDGKVVCAICWLRLDPTC